MMKFYEIPRSVLFERTEELSEWLRDTGRTKRGKDKFIFGRVVPGTIAFTDPKIATLFVLKFGATRLKPKHERG